MRWLCLLFLSGCAWEGLVPDDVTLRPLGRVSEPSHNVAPKGSLLKAENCVIRKPGVIEPLPALEIVSSNNGPDNLGVWQQSPLFENGTDPLKLTHVSSGSGSQQGARSSGTMNAEITYTDVDGSSASIEYYDHGDGLTMAPMYLSRGNLYVADKRGLYKWSSTDDASLERIRDATGNGITTTGSATTPTWLDNGKHVKYRIVQVFEDANGVIRRSAPSVVHEQSNTSGAATSVEIENILVAVDNYYGSFTGVEVYRTRSFDNSVTLPNQYYLVRTIDAGEFTQAATGYPYAVSSIIDTVDDTQLGAALYTNTGQGGESSANIVPPEHLYHAEFRGHQFWANVAEKEFFPELRNTSATALSDFTHTVNGTYTSGSDTITGVASLDGLEVGMLQASVNFPVGTYVTAITGAGPYTITVSNDATSSGTDDIVFYDTAFIRWGDGSTSRLILYPLSGVASIVGGGEGELFSLSGSLLGDDSYYSVVFVLASKHRVARMGSAQIWVSNPDSYEANVDWADLNTGTGAPTTGGTPAKQALHRRRIYWSKLQEPEHTTLLSFKDLPDEIVGLGSLEDALIILTRSGVHRLTGDNGNWRIDPMDTSVTIIGGRSTAVMGNAIYTLGDRGLLRITSSGVPNLSDGIVGDWFVAAGYAGDSRIEGVREYMLNNDGYHPPSLFAAADQTNREYALVCDSSFAADGVPDEMLVYNAKSDAFVTWDLSESGTVGVSSLGYAVGDFRTYSQVQAPGLVFGRRVSDADASAAIHVLNNREDQKPNSTWSQDIRFRAMHFGDPTHIKLWTAVIWDTTGYDSGDAQTAVFQDSEEGSDVTQTIDSIDGEEIRIWPPLDVVRATKLVIGIQGTGLTIYGLRATYVSSGREAPL